MCYEAIIFDFNGVLWWDSRLQEQAWSRMAEKLRGKPFTEDEMINIVYGRPGKVILEYLTGRSLEGAELAGLIQEKEGAYRDLCLLEKEAFCLSPGARELLDFLSEYDIPRTISTASEKTNLDFWSSRGIQRTYAECYEYTFTKTGLVFQAYNSCSSF